MFALEQLTKKKTTKKATKTVPPKPAEEKEKKPKKIQTRKKKNVEPDDEITTPNIPTETEEKIFSTKAVPQKSMKQTALQKYLSLPVEEPTTIDEQKDEAKSQNESTTSKESTRLSKKTDVKSYGIGISKKEQPQETENKNLILHIPVILDHKKVHIQYGDSPVPYFADMTQDIIQSKLKKPKECKDCFVTESGGLIYCDNCQSVFNEKQETKRNFEKLMQDRERDDILFNVDEERDEHSMPPPVYETKMEGDHPLPVYDPLIDESISVISSTVKPSSLINQEIDNRDPTRDDYERLRYEYDLLEQRYSKLLNENRSTNNNESQINNNVWKDRLRIIELMKQAKIRMAKAFELPNIFNDKNVWPKQVYTCCMYDAHPFETVPIPLPLNYNQATNTFKVFGCFCSFQCMLGFKKGNRSLDHIDTSLIFFFLNKFQEKFGRIIPEGSHLYPAPSPYSLLDIYGGPMTIEQYRSMVQFPTIQCELIGFPLEPVPQFLQVTNQLVSAELDVGFMENMSDPKRQKKLKIVRSKPLPNHKNRLEASMGLFIDPNAPEE